jgi:hypothetical protein
VKDQTASEKILAKATAVLGSQEEAELWLEHPAIGLDQHRPIDREGVKVVAAHRKAGGSFRFSTYAIPASCNGSHCSTATSQPSGPRLYSAVLSAPGILES